MADDRANDGNGGGRNKGVTNAEVETRVHLVYEMMLQGLRPNNIVDLLRANEQARGTTKYRPELDWQVEPRQVRDYYARAWDMLKAEQVEDRRAMFVQSIRRFDDLYRRALAANDTRAARQHLNDRNRLLELNYFDDGGVPGANKLAQGDPEVVIELPGGRTFRLA